ncbi:MAG: DMT family transporter [Oscillospiraceae bacterium]|jgi:transporter family-2 protein|nr:DMT family transporter [Oscillospiraceae bacterium]
MIGILIAIISGTLMSLQGVFNTGVTKQTNLWLTSSFVQLSAFAVCIAAWFFTGHEGGVADLFRIDNKFMLLGGVMGAFITITVVKSMDMLGPARAVMLIVVAQLLVAYVVELFGMFGVEKVSFEWHKLAGVALAIVGIVIFKWK